jgi:hypothetical protein
MLIRDCSPTRVKLSKISERHPKLVLDQINQLRRNSELCDVVLSVGSCKIPTHKVILCASSPYFMAMFTSQLAESKQTEITIKVGVNIPHNLRQHLSQLLKLISGHRRNRNGATC